MNANLRALVAACKKLNVAYQSLHSSENLVRVQTSSGSYLFANWTTPVNCHSSARVCEDKDYCHTLLGEALRMPRTLSFLNPYVDEQYRKYAEYKDYQSITAAIEELFSYPLIIKRNRGSHGSNVLLVQHHQELLKSLETVFDLQSRHYDYVALAQEYVQIEAEYRTIFLNGKLAFSYLKDISAAECSDNLSPLHWEGARAVLVSDEQLLLQMQEFVTPAFNIAPLAYVGVDIAVDKNGQLWALEFNSSPGFEHFVRDCGSSELKKLYENMLRTFMGAE